MTPMRQKPFAWQDFSGAGKYVVKAFLLFLGSVYSMSFNGLAWYVSHENIG